MSNQSNARRFDWVKQFSKILKILKKVFLNDKVKYH